MPTINDISMVAPALAKYAQGPLADLWKRMGPFSVSLDGSSLVCAGNYSGGQWDACGVMQCPVNPLVPLAELLQTRA
jgi:hypothetical protein